MKHGRFLLIGLSALLLLGAGYYLTLNNLVLLLDQPNLGKRPPVVQCHWQGGKFVINYGSRREVMVMRFWPRISRNQNGIQVQTGGKTIEVQTRPRWMIHVREVNKKNKSRSGVSPEISNKI